MTSTSPPGPPGAAVDDPGIDDRELLRRHTAGDPDAFSELFRRHRDRMWAVALRTLSDPEEAADALQDAMISAFRNAAQFRGDSAVTTWLHRVVVNACLDRIRRRNVRQADPLPEGDRATELAGPQHDSADSLQTRMDVLTALRELNDDQRAAIVLVDMEGYSVTEAASMLDCAPGTVKSRCARGRARLVPLLSHLHDNPVERNLSPARNQGSPPGVARTAPEPPTATPEHDYRASPAPPGWHQPPGGDDRNGGEPG